MKVIFSPKVQDYLDGLIPILHEKGYFSFEAAAINYVDTLIDDILDRLPVMLHRPASPYFDRYGKDMCYVSLRKNKQTTWYIFFTRYSVEGEVVFLVRYITNNHVSAQFL